MDQPNEPPQRKKKKKKITAAFLKKKGLGCDQCKHFEKVEVEDSVEDEVFAFVCNAPMPGAPLEGMPAAGARSHDRWCGMAGKFFRPKGQKQEPEKAKVESKDGSEEHAPKKQEPEKAKVGEG